LLLTGVLAERIIAAEVVDLGLTGPSRPSRHSVRPCSDQVFGGHMKAAALVCMVPILSAALALAQNPVPFVNQPLVPASAVPGGPSFTLTVNGTGFVSGATVNWDGAALTTTLVSGSQLTAAVPAANILNPGTASVRVANPAPGGGVSQIEYFQVVTPATSITFTNLGQDMDTLVPPVVTGDFNGDGKLDLAGIDMFHGLLCVVPGNGDGTFGTSLCSSSTSIQFTFDLTAADFNGDGKLDLAATDPTNNQVEIFLGNGDGTFKTPMIFATGGVPVSVVAGDFNRDGKLDLAIGNNGNGVNEFGSLSILLGNGDGTFQNPVDYRAGTPATKLVVGDFNTDGKLDIVVANESSINVEIGNGDGTFQPGTSIPFVGIGALTAGDLNGDGKLDLVVGNGLIPQSFSAYLGNGDGTFQRPTAYSVNEAQSIAIADINADGILDVVDVGVDHVGDNFLFIFLGNGDGTLQPPTFFQVLPDSLSLTTADFNNDGRVDLEVSGFSLFAVFLQGVFPAAAVFPSDVPFKPQPVSTTSGLQVVALKNAGTATMVLSKNQITGPNAAEFAILSTGCGSTLAPGASCPINVTFTPATIGTRTATLNIADNAPGTPQTVALSGSGQDFALSATPMSVTVKAGQQADYTLAIAPLGGFDHSVVLSCSGGPVGSSCSVLSPVVLNGVSTANIPFSVVTPPSSARLVQPSISSKGGGRLAACLALPGFFGLVALTGVARAVRAGQATWLYGLVFLCVLAFGATMPACGGGGGGGSGGGGTGGGGGSTGTFTVAVTGTVTSGSKSLIHHLDLTLVVQ
jgi:hypothetical protein